MQIIIKCLLLLLMTINGNRVFAKSDILKEVDNMHRDQKEKFLDYYDLRIKKEEESYDKRILSQQNPKMQPSCFSEIQKIYEDFLSNKYLLKRSFDDTYSKMRQKAVEASNKLKNNISDQSLFSLYHKQERAWDELYDFEQSYRRQQIDLYDQSMAKARAIKQRWLNTLK
ncbi:MAG: hypothetical protein ACRCTJ_00625 [Brevinema sp.]